ncbi:MAG: DUF222 domain-containing protein [Mycobacterium sp.]
MFDQLPDSASRAEMSDAEIDAAISAWTAAVAAGSAHRFLLIAEKTSRNYNEDWEILEDTEAAWNSAAAEISLASGISHGRACGDMEVGLALAVRLQSVATLLLTGQISERIARRIVQRTANIQDPDLLALVEADIVECAIHWGGLSQQKLDAAIDVWVDRHDPGALRQTRVRVRDRGVQIVESKGGVTELVARLKGPDAALLIRRLSVMARGVCPDDPRTFQQRLADSAGALGAGYFHLACDCGNPECTAAVEDGRASSVVVYVYAEGATLAAQPDPLMDGDGSLPDEGDVAPVDSPAASVDGAPDAIADGCPDGSAESSPDATAAGSPDATVVGSPSDGPSGGPPPGDGPQPSRSSGTRRQRSSPVRRPPPGIIPGFGHTPAEEIAAKIAAGAKIRHLTAPGKEPESRYRPKVALDEWVRARDLTCRFPNCDRPAQFCDWDHTVPWPAGPTHASGGKMLCRLHHLGKTFWAGWSDVQHPDGTVVWTTPTGQTYTTKPGSSLFFPSVDTTSATIVTGTPFPNGADKLQKMPQRQKRYRSRERAARIKAERALNDAYVAERNRPPPF